MTNSHSLNNCLDGSWWATTCTGEPVSVLIPTVSSHCIIVCCTLQLAIAGPQELRDRPCVPQSRARGGLTPAAGSRQVRRSVSAYSSRLFSSLLCRGIKVSEEFSL